MKKKKYIVLARNKKTALKGITTGKGHRSFGKYSALWISDPAEAREIENQYGMKGSKDVSVTTDQQYEWSVNNEGSNGTRMDNIHKYTFGRMGISLPDRHSLRGRVKVINDTAYVYVMRGSRLKLEPLPQKRTKRAPGAPEVKHG